MHFRLLGFPISLHYSWLVAFCLLTWALSTAMFKDVLPGVPMRAHWAAGAVATLFILASVLFHEIAHVVLGHTAESLQTDSERTPRNLREAEAESVALLCCAALELPGIEYSRGYIQAWWGQGNPIPEKSAQRILKVADQILRAGREQSAGDEGVA